MQLITNAHIIPTDRVNLEVFDLQEQKDKYFDYYVVQTSQDGTITIETINQLSHLVHKNEREILDTKTSHTRADTYKHFSSLAVQKRMAEAQQQQIHEQTISGTEAKQLKEGLQTHQENIYERFKGFPPFNQHAGSAEAVYPLDGLLSLNIEGFLCHNKEKVSIECLAAHGIAEDAEVEPSEQFSTIAPGGALQAFAPGLRLRSSPESSLLAGLIAEFQGKNVPFISQYLKAHIQQPKRSNQTISYILAFAVHCLQNHVPLGKLAADMKARQADIEKIAISMGFVVKDGFAWLKTPIKIPGLK